MCWIFWYKWNRTDAQKILIHGLERLEYRGYDSAGLVVLNRNGEPKLLRAVGKVSNLASKVSKEIDEKEKYGFGIAHTRRATHGGILENNTHPHYDQNQNFFLVHNGIIENYYKLKNDLLAKWYKFYGQTDSEVIANLLEDNWNGNFLETVEKVMLLIRWAFALLIISKHNPGEIIWVKIGSPLIFGYSNEGDYFFASDKQALAWYIDKFIYLDDWDIIHVKDKDYQIKSGWVPVRKKVEDMDLQALETSKWDYKHFMLKEIFEQPNIIRRIFKWRVDFNQNLLHADAFHGMQDENYKKIIFVACGTSYNAWCLGAYWMQNLAWLESSAEIASEYEYKNIKVDDQTLFVFISQSGETADSIEVLKMLKEKWAHTFGIVNVVGSSISRLTDFGLFTRWWAEIWVASTKAFTAQVTCILMLALFLWKKRNLNKSKYDKIMIEFSKVPVMIEEVLSDAWNIRQIAEKIAWYKNLFYLWRHYQLPIANEWSLKLKEISYLHSESYPSWELKHWPLALIDEKVPSVLFVPNDLMFEKNVSSIQEIKARKWVVLTISDKDIQNSDFNIRVPSTIDEIYPFLTVIVAQLFAYHVADFLGKDIDKPRNLAKSVTVK